jgi:hypothetical protein
MITTQDGQFTYSKDRQMAVKPSQTLESRKFLKPLFFILILFLFGMLVMKSSRPISRYF